MIGLRSSLFALVAGMAVLVFVPPQAANLVLDLVKTNHQFSVMRTEVTIDQWHACVSDGYCSFQPKPGLGAYAGNFPVTGISALDALEFERWAQAKVASHLRLPTLAEWYRFSDVEPERPNEVFSDSRLAWAASYSVGGKRDPVLRQSGGFGVNAQSVADVTGNVWEFTSTCVLTTVAQSRCPAFFAAGEHEAKMSVFVRDPSSGGCAAGRPPAHLGLRLVMDNP